MRAYENPRDILPGLCIVSGPAQPSQECDVAEFGDHATPHLTVITLRKESDVKNPTLMALANSTSVVSREDFVLCKALVYAIAHIQNLPEDQQEFSDLCDMAALARERFGVIVPACVLGMEWHSGRTADLWPEGTPTERDRLLKP